MIFREWKLSDVGSVVALEKKCFSDPWNADMVLSSFNLPQFVGFVAENDGEVIAYVGATYCSSPPTKNTAERASRRRFFKNFSINSKAKT